MFEIARVNFLVVFQPISHFLDVRWHVEVIVHGAFSSLYATTFRDRAPAAIGEEFGKAFGALRAEAVLSPPFRHLWLVGRAGAAFVEATHTIGELHEAADVIRRWMAVGK